jgi:hypothetical protein
LKAANLTTIDVSFEEGSRDGPTEWPIWLRDKFHLPNSTYLLMEASLMKDQSATATVQGIKNVGTANVRAIVQYYNLTDTTLHNRAAPTVFSPTG